MLCLSNQLRGNTSMHRSGFNYLALTIDYYTVKTVAIYSSLQSMLQL